MTSPYTEPAFALIVTAAAMLWPPLALAVASVYLLAIMVVNDRRTVTPPEPE